MGTGPGTLLQDASVLNMTQLPCQTTPSPLQDRCFKPSALFLNYLETRRPIFILQTYLVFIFFGILGDLNFSEKKKRPFEAYTKFLSFEKKRGYELI